MIFEVDFGDSSEVQTGPAFKLRDYQFGWMGSVRKERETFTRLLGVAATGTGKCLGRGTQVMLHTGMVVPVESITAGDVLIGPDSGPRLVRSVCSGREMLYRVTPTKGNTYVVNESHILSLKITGNRGVYHDGETLGGGSIANTSVIKYLSGSKHFKHCAKGWRVGVDFKKKDIHPDMPPYILGLWLGDGSSHIPAFTTMDPEIRSAVQGYAASLGLNCRVYNKTGCPIYSVTSPFKTGRGPLKNRAIKALNELGIRRSKSVPFNYKTSSKFDRLELLAGLIDSDGSLSCGGYDLISSLQSLSDDVCFLARSVGLAAYLSPQFKTCGQNGKTGLYYRVSISGDCSIIPCRVARKIAPKRLQKKSVLVTGIKIEPIGVGDYFGFEIGGADRLFLLGDFTVTHNTSFFAALSHEEVTQRGGRVLILENRDKLVRQTAKRIQKETGIEAEVEMAGDRASPFASVVVASVQTLCKDERLMGFPEGHFTVVVADESHHALSKSWQKVLNYFHYGANSLIEGWEAPLDGTYTPKCLVMGVTATPELANKQSLGEFYQSQSFYYTYIDAVRDGWLVPPETRNIPLKINLKDIRVGRTPNGSDFNASDLSQRLIPVLEALADQIVTEASDRKGIVFVPSIECARLLADALTRRGLKGIFVSGECLDVDEKTEDFVNSGTGTFLCNAALYVEGADFPDVNCVVPARATKSAGFYKQQIGRGTRVLPGTVDHLGTPEERREAISRSNKPNLLILDPLWISDRIDLCDAYDLFTDKPEVKAKMKFDGAPPSAESAEAAARDLIAALAKEAKKHAKKQARVIDPLAWAVSVGDAALANWKPESKWESDPPTAGQLSFLRQNGIGAAKITQKGMASKIIGRVLARHKLGLATGRQLSLMHQLGLDEQSCATLTQEQAKATIDRLIAAKNEKGEPDDAAPAPDDLFDPTMMEAN